MSVWFLERLSVFPSCATFEACTEVFCLFSELYAMFLDLVSAFKSFQSARAVRDLCDLSLFGSRPHRSLSDLC